MNNLQKTSPTSYSAITDYYPKDEARQLVEVFQVMGLADLETGKRGAAHIELAMQRPNLLLLKSRYGADAVKAVALLLLTLRDSYKMPAEHRLGGHEIRRIARRIVDEFGDMVIDDVARFCERVSYGDFGKAFGRFDMETFWAMWRGYCADRAQELEDYHARKKADADTRMNGGGFNEDVAERFAAIREAIADKREGFAPPAEPTEVDKAFFEFVALERQFTKANPKMTRHHLHKYMGARSDTHAYEMWLAAVEAGDMAEIDRIKAEAGKVYQLPV